ncbi:hypothetical protein GYA19_02830 [Candidatus Beckwithbacteria bacterium]|nr:hypothetical protein [Candidatus Beckwithbacteria bacterium]
MAFIYYEDKRDFMLKFFHRPILLSIGIIFLVAAILAFRFFKFVVIGHDYMYYLGNTFALTVALNAQHFSLTGLQIAPVILNNLGYGIRIFTPILSHLVPALIFLFLKLFGIGSISLALKLFQFFIIFGSGLGMYYAVIKITHHKTVALLSAVFYLSFPYFLSEFYVRSALGEALCFVGLPVVFLSCYQFLTGQYKKFFYHFIFGFAVIFFSHLITALYTAIIFIIVILSNFRSWYKQKIAWLACVKVFITCCLLFAPFLVSLLEHRFAVDYVVFHNTDLRSQMNVADSTLRPRHYLFFNNLDANDIVFTLNPVVLVLVLVAIVKFKAMKSKNNLVTKTFLIALIMSGICLILACFPFFWLHVPKLFNFIQYPWRLTVFVALLLSFAAATPFLFLRLNKVGYFLTGLVIILTVVISYKTTNLVKITDLDNIDYTSATNLFAVGTYYESLSTAGKNNFNNLLKREGLVRIVNASKSETKTSTKILVDDTPYLLFTIEQTDPSLKTVLELPRLYYLGYQIVFTKPNKEKVPLSYQQNQFGLIQIETQGSGQVEVKYVGTFWYRLSLIIFAFTILTLVIAMVLDLKRVDSGKKKIQNNS